MRPGRLTASATCLACGRPEHAHGRCPYRAGGPRCGFCHRFVRRATVRALGLGHTGECRDHGRVEVYWGRA